MIALIRKSGMGKTENNEQICNNDDAYNRKPKCCCLKELTESVFKMLTMATTKANCAVNTLTLITTYVS